LARSKIGAERFVGEMVMRENNSKGIISSTFGTKGFVVANFEEAPRQGERVSIRKYRVFNIT
jgi:ribosomal protein L35AE/L33A